jgi:hypothetical protein
MTEEELARFALQLRETERIHAMIEEEAPLWPAAEPTGCQ